MLSLHYRTTTSIQMGLEEGSSSVISQVLTIALPMQEGLESQRERTGMVNYVARTRHTESTGLFIYGRQEERVSKGVCMFHL